MRIISIGNFSTGWDGSICDEVHIADALEEFGYEVIRLQRENLDKLLADPGVIEFVLVAQWDGYPYDMCKNLSMTFKCPIIYWTFDYQADGQTWHEHLVSQSDLYLSKRIADSKYKNWRWLSQDFAPLFLDKHPLPVEKDIDVLFTGSYLDWAHERNATLKAVDERFDLHIYGVTPDAWKNAGFKNVHGPVMDDALPALIARAKINLSIDHTHEAGYWSDRNAQIMACSGFVLFRHVPLSESVFRQKIAYFYGIEDCLESIEQLLDMPSEDMRMIEEMGRNYAHEELTVMSRVGDLLTIVEEVL